MKIYLGIQFCCTIWLIIYLYELRNAYQIKLYVKQECFPVGCVPPALYSTWGVSVQGVSVQGFLSRGLFPGRSLSSASLSRGSLSRGSLSREVSVQRGLCPGGLPRHRQPRRNMGSEIETPPKEHGTRQPDREWHLRVQVNVFIEILSPVLTSGTVDLSTLITTQDSIRIFR